MSKSQFHIAQCSVTIRDDTICAFKLAHPLIKPLVYLVDAEEAIVIRTVFSLYSQALDSLKSNEARMFSNITKFFRERSYN